MKYLLIVFAAFSVAISVPGLPLLAAGMNEVSINSSGQMKSWTVELASDDQSRATGLMFKKNMPEMTGMLFRFDDTRPVSMWMKNTFIPLDMIFADENGKVTHIHKGAVPHSLEVISSQGPVRFVLEINAGEADAHGLKAGDILLHPWILPGN